MHVIVFTRCFNYLQYFSSVSLGFPTMTVLSGEVVEIPGIPIAAKYQRRPRWLHGTLKHRVSDAELDEMDNVIRHAYLTSVPDSCSLFWWNRKHK